MLTEVENKIIEKLKPEIKRFTLSKEQLTAIALIIKEKTNI